MSWKSLLTQLRSLAKTRKEIEIQEEIRKSQLRKEKERLNKAICGRVKRVSKRFASVVGWDFMDDVGSHGRLATKFFIHPPFKSNSLSYLERQITIEISYDDGEIKISLPSSNQTAIPFDSFDEEELARVLKEMYEEINLSTSRVVSDEKFEDKELPDTLSLGWYWSENKNKFQMAKTKAKDRSVHFYIIGASGSGKTKFLEFLIQQDIENNNGFGIIDPHGDLIEDIKGFLACYYHSYQDEEIFDRVVLIDPTDSKFTVTFNPLERLPNISVAEQSAELTSAFKKIWADSWGVRMEDLLRNSLIALGEAELTLAELPQLLTNKEFRESVLAQVSHPIVLDYFRRFNTLTERAQISWIEPVMNKINAFLFDERIRQILSFPKSSFNFREIMDKKKILLVKLEKGKLKDSADLFGSLIMAKIQMAAFSRSDIPFDRRVPFYLYIDEFQNFASESFLVLLSEARKYGLSLIMAHQTLAQISQELKSSILGNTGIQVYFRLNRQDAQLLAKECFEYSGYEIKEFTLKGHKYWSLGEEWEHHTEKLQNLRPRTCYVKHKIEGGMIPITTVNIEPPWEILKMEENEYKTYLSSLPFGKKYLLPREKVANLLKERAALVKAKPTLKEEPPKEQISITPKIPVKTEPEESESQHRYLQTLIKKVAQEKGYRATIEVPILDGQGRVDVDLERDKKKIACEISVTTTDEQELSNIKKCLRADYQKVVLCSLEKKTLEKVKALVAQKLNQEDQQKVLFFQPEELFSYLEKEVALEASKEERIKGYKVKVQYQPVGEVEKKAKRETIAQVILQSLRRLKGQK